VKPDVIAPRPNQLRICAGLTKYALLSTIRNRSTLVFSLIFPVAFVMIFGLLSGANPKLDLGVSSRMAAGNPVLRVVTGMAGSSKSPLKLTYGDDVVLEDQLRHGKLDGVLESGADTTAVVLATSNASPQGGQASGDIVTSVVNELNLRAAEAAAGGDFSPPFHVTGREVSGKKYRFIDFALPGQIGFSLLSIATFGVAFPMLTMRKTLVLKRMFASGVKPITFLAAQGASRCIQAVIQAGIIVLVGIYGFNFTLANGYVTFAEMLFLSMLGVLTFLGFGLVVANIARDEQAVPMALNLFNLPQMLLCAVFFPTDSFPGWLQAIGNNLPLAYYNIALRKIAIDGASLVSVWPYMLGMLAWSVVAYIAAALTFKSE
jgi:ABC-2 type transport system permease protein